MEKPELITLLARVIGGKTSFAKAERIANAYSTPEELAKASADEIAARAEITQAEAERTAAAIELTRHFYGIAEQQEKASNPEMLFRVFAPLLANRQQECLAVCILNAQNRPTKTEIIYRGTQDEAPARISEIFKLAITCNAGAVAFAHNHPSGSLDESPEDVKLTRAMVEAGKLLDVRVLDHLIIGSPKDYASIRANNPQIWQ